MNAFPDTSFLYALYRQQDNSPQALSHFAGMTEPIYVSALLLYEFRQSVHFQVYRNSQNPRMGFSKDEGLKALSKLQLNLASGGVVLAPATWAEVLSIGERLSSQYVSANGHRTFDILHVATALSFGARELLSFDANQRKLALAEGLAVNP